MAKFLKKAEAQAEGNIRAYSEKQQAALSALQVRARRDRQTLMRMLAHIQVSRSCVPTVLTFYLPSIIPSRFNFIFLFTLQ